MRRDIPARIIKAPIYYSHSLPYMVCYVIKVCCSR